MLEDDSRSSFTGLRSKENMTMLTLVESKAAENGATQATG